MQIMVRNIHEDNNGGESHGNVFKSKIRIGAWGVLDDGILRYNVYHYMCNLGSSHFGFEMVAMVIRVSIKNGSVAP